MMIRYRFPYETFAAGVAVLLVTGLALAYAALADRRADAAERARDQATTELVVARAQAAGWAAKAGTERRGFLAAQARGDSMAAALERALRTGGARPVARTVVTASAAGEVRIPAKPRPDSVTAAAEDSVTAAFESGPLTGDLSYHLRDRRFGLRWQARVPLELVHAIGADRRLLVFGRSSDPRVTLEVDTLEYQLPAPERRGSPVRCAAVAAGAGAGAALAPSWWSAGGALVATVFACR